MVPTKVEEIRSRRIILNWRVQPRALSLLLPKIFKPHLVDGFGILCVSLLEMEELKPKGLPSTVILKAQNVAPRIPVEWGENGQSGVYIPNRYAPFKWNSFASKLRFFPTAFNQGQMGMNENEHGQLTAWAEAGDGLSLFFEGKHSKTIGSGSVFGTIEGAAEFLEWGGVAFSPKEEFKQGIKTAKIDAFERIYLPKTQWTSSAIKVANVFFSLVFDNFSDATAIFDSALVMTRESSQLHYLGCGSPCEREQADGAA